MHNTLETFPFHTLFYTDNNEVVGYGPHFAITVDCTTRVNLLLYPISQ